MAWPMATTSNAAMRKKTPFYVTVLMKRTTSYLLSSKYVASAVQAPITHASQIGR